MKSELFVNKKYVNMYNKLINEIIPYLSKASETVSEVYEVFKDGYSSDNQKSKNDEFEEVINDIEDLIKKLNTKFSGVSKSFV